MLLDVKIGRVTFIAEYNVIKNFILAKYRGGAFGSQCLTGAYRCCAPYNKCVVCGSFKKPCGEIVFCLALLLEYGS